LAHGVRKVKGNAQKLRKFLCWSRSLPFQGAADLAAISEFPPRFVDLAEGFFRRKNRVASAAMIFHIPARQHQGKGNVMKRLEGKVAIIAGASSGVGAAAARLFAREGAAVVLGARRPAPLGRLVEEIEADGGRASAFAGDLTDETCVQNLVARADEVFGGLDVAFNTVGALGEVGDAPDLSLDAWRETIEVNLTTAFALAKYQLPLLERRAGASLIFTSSFVGYTVGMPGMAAYAASKAGLIGLTKSLAAEYGPRSLRVNALLPGGTDTDMATHFAATPEALAQVCAIHALNRIADPKEIAQAALFLASDDASFVTGAAFLADGGVSIYRG
jgi:NAD(P)-dependent dehydrogenase (short-subunit alcohol dehydrogenase family)